MPILAVCGMEAEARIARRAGIAAIVIGGSAVRRRAKLMAAMAARPAGLVSFGIAGALDPGLPSGAIIVPDAVRTSDGAIYHGDAGWSRRVATRSPGGEMSLFSSSAGSPRPKGAVAGPGSGAVIIGAEQTILGADEIVVEAVRKRSLFQETGAIAVDLESGIVAEVAMHVGVPFLVLRAIADAALRDLPPAAIVGLDDAGRPAPVRVLRSVLSRPGQIPSLVRLASETRRALGALALATRDMLPFDVA
jgi:adenosylhomocysteine nucleosidase